MTLDKPVAAVLAVLRESAASADQLARRTGLTPAELAAALSELELAGLATTVDGVYRAAPG
jgi:predicted Rossmann fold nucleotide-binding protein DprA/Smf involved in DNA uptake